MNIANMSTTADKYHTCVDGLKAYISALGISDVVLGLSGGIDSAVVACMCADAFGPTHVHGVLMPGPYSSKHSVTDAHELAQNLGIHAVCVPITEAYEAFNRSISLVSDSFSGIASENTQARCRMVVLMALSNAHNWMLINTDNKSEAMMGYSTLYGDTAGVYAPMGGLYKIDVYAIAYWLNNQAAQRGLAPCIPEHILLKPPSAELALDQRDEDVFGSYDDLDRILIACEEHGMSQEDLVAQGEDAAYVSYVFNRIHATAFKRALLPPYPHITY